MSLDADRITIARLDGTARRQIHDQVPGDQAIAAVREITTDPALLAEASGTALGGWQADPVSSYLGARVSRLLDAAGADPELRDEWAAYVKARLDGQQGSRRHP